MMWVKVYNGFKFVSIKFKYYVLVKSILGSICNDIKMPRTNIKLLA